MFFLKPRKKTFDMDGAGTVIVPGALSGHMRTDSPDHVTHIFYDVIDSIFWMGSNTPVRAVMTAAVGAPDRDTATLPRLAAKEAADRCRNVRWEQPIAAGARQVRTASCIYEVNTHIESSWLVEVADPARRVAMAYRFFQRDMKLQNGAEALVAAIESYIPPVRPAELFREIRDRPRREAEEIDIAEVKAMRWIAKQGWPPPQLEKTVRHKNFVYSWERHFTPTLETACVIGWLPATGYKKPEFANRLWRDHSLTVATYATFRDEWQLSHPGQLLDIHLKPWNGFASDSFDTSRVYLFIEGGMQFRGYTGGEDPSKGLSIWLRACEESAKLVNPLP